MHYKALPDSNDPEVSAILASIEKRWKKADQDVFITTIILNPFLKATPFQCLPSMATADILTLLQWLWLRLYKMPASLSLFTDIQDYLGNKGTFEGMDQFAATIEGLTLAEVSI